MYCMKCSRKLNELVDECHGRKYERWADGTIKVTFEDSGFMLSRPNGKTIFSAGR